jgi:hypothetical protein
VTDGQSGPVRSVRGPGKAVPSFPVTIRMTGPIRTVTNGELYSLQSLPVVIGSRTVPQCYFKTKFYLKSPDIYGYLKVSYLDVPSLAMIYRLCNEKFIT